MPRAFRNRVGAALVCLAALLPALPYAASIHRIGRLPSHDYYWVIGQITNDQGGFTGDPIRWLSVKSNEHNVLFPALVFAANARLFAGNNRGLSVFAILLMAATLGLLHRLASPDAQDSLWTRIAVASALGAFAFTPGAAHNVVYGYSGSQWLLSNVFAIGALVALERRSRGGPLWPVVALTALGALSYSTSLFVWPAILLGALLLRLRRRDFATLAVAAVVLVGVSLAMYSRPQGHPAPETRHALTIFRYVARFLGSLFTTDPRAAVWLGMGGLLVGAALGFLTVRAGGALRARAVPWLLVQAYGAANAVAAAVFRSGLDTDPGQSRYATLAALVWIGLLMTCLATLRSEGSPGGSVLRLGRLLSFALLVLALAVPMYARGLTILGQLLDGAAFNPIAARSLVLGIHDDKMIRFVTSYPEEIWAVMPFLRNARQVPFDEPPPADDAQRVAQHPPSPEVAGHLELLERVDDRYARAEGWAHGTGSPIRDVVVADADGIVRGHAILGLPRPDVAKAVASDAGRSGWCAYVRISAPTAEVTALARRVADESFSPLIGRKAIP